MKRLFFILSCLWVSFSFCQEIPAETIQQLEELAQLTETETEDDGLIQELEQLSRRALPLNRCTREELEQVPFLSAFQVNSFIHYREILGALISVYELQSIPSFDLQTIRKILPYVIIDEPGSAKDLIARAVKGEHSFLLRAGAQFQKAAGYRDGTYPGSPAKIFFRYRYNLKNKLQWGITGDKDAGEGFFSGHQRLGFDFYSFHFYLRGKGLLKALALGDFTVNLGQGLVHWQSLAFGKGSELAGIKRQSPVIKPYTSSGEFNFMRGGAFTLRKGHWNGSFFFSLRKLDGNYNGESVSSLISSGYHREESEIADRAVLSARSMGTNLTYKKGNLQWGLNAVHYGFGLPIEKSEEPYNFYSLRGRSWWNLSIDHSYTLQNLHFFGEIARSKGGGMALVQGVVFSVHRDVDLTVLFREISPRYQSLYGNAFSQSTLPVNERGVYMAGNLRPTIDVRIDLYADIYRSGWLKFRSDAPSSGSDLSFQCTYAFSKKSSFIFRVRARQQEENLPVELQAGPTKTISKRRGQQLRIHLNQQLSGSFEIRSRAELNFYRLENRREEGFLFYTELLYKPVGKRLGGSIRASVFDTDSYDSRIYAFESNVLYSYSIPIISGKGARFYVNTHFKLNSSFSFWLRLAGSFYTGDLETGTGAGLIRGSTRSDWVFQARVNL